MPPTNDDQTGQNPDRNQARVSAILDALIGRAEHGDLEAARNAARFAAGRDNARAAQALDVMLRLDPRDEGARLALARLRAGGGDLSAARREAESVFAHAVDEAARAQAALTLGDIARLQGRYVEARAHFTETLGIESQILNARPGDPTALRWHARAMGRIADVDAVEGALERARTHAEGGRTLLLTLAGQTGESPILAADIADSELRLAQLALAEDQPTAMKPHLDAARARYEALALLEKDEPHWRDQLAEVWALSAEAALAQGDGPAARAAIDKAVSQRVWLANREAAEGWALAALWRQRAGLLFALKDAPAAAESLSLALNLAEALAEAETNPETSARFLLHTRLEQADLAFAMGDIELARAAADAARDGAEPYARQDDAWAGDLAAAWDRLGDIAKAVSAAEQARDAFTRAVDLRRMSQADKDSAPLKRALAAALIKAGEAALSMQNFKEARTAFSESFALRLDLAEAEPGAAEPARDLGVALERLGLVARAEGDPDGARAAWEQELALIEHIHADDDPAGLRFAAITEMLLAGLQGPDSEARRQSARVRMAQLETLVPLTVEDAALIERLKAPN